MRAKKFGAPVSTDVKKLVRAERFGETANSTTTTAASNDGTKKTITLNNSVSIYIKFSYLYTFNVSLQLMCIKIYNTT